MYIYKIQRASGSLFVLPLFVKYECFHTRDGIVVICCDGQNDKKMMLDFQYKDSYFSILLCLEFRHRKTP